MAIPGSHPQARTPFVGGRLRLARARLGLRQADVAERLGIGRAMVGHVETGARSPSGAVLARIEAFLESVAPEEVSS